MKKRLLIFAAGLLLLFAACANDTVDIPGDQDIVDPSSEPENDTDSPQPGVQTISATEARRVMEEADSFILLDVRTEAEFQESRIDGALLIPYDEIRDRIEAEIPDKNATILIYCRSGRRSAAAAADLAALGYTNIYDFGGIIDWSYETVSG